MNYCGYLNRTITVIILLLSIHTLCSSKKLLYLKPPPGLEYEGLFNLTSPSYGPDQRMKPLYVLKRALINKGYDVKIISYKSSISKADALIAFSEEPPPEFSKKMKALIGKRILVVTEPPSVLPQLYTPQCASSFTSVLVMDDKRVDNRKYFKFNYPFSIFKQTSTIIPFEQKKFCILLASQRDSDHPHELYSQRLKTILFFEQKNPSLLSLYGKGWENLHLKTYKGSAKNKSDVMPFYKFCICYENLSSMHGYITEKIFDCFINRCIPIYWGAPNVADYIPPSCYIDRRTFSSNEKLFDYLRKMTKKRYEFHQKEISQFILSNKAQKFSINNFVNAVLVRLA
jgi:alpha(1,3/1,4) fucosyltransferase